MLVTHYKCLVFLLISFFLFGCGDAPEPEPEPELEPELELDYKSIVTLPGNGNGKGNSITPDSDVVELDLDDVEALLQDIRVPTDRDNKEPVGDIVNHEAAPEIDIGDIQNVIPNVRVPVHQEHEREENQEHEREENQDVTAPKIVHSNIKDGAKNVGRASLTKITFSEPIAKGTLVLRTEGGRVVETDIQYGNKIVEIKRLGKDFIMKPLTTYIIEGSVSDAAGNKTKINITFTTGDIEAIKGF